MIKDPLIRQQIQEMSIRAAKIALSQGKTQEQALLESQNAIRLGLEQLKPVIKTVEQGIEEVVQLLDEFEKREEVNKEVLSYDFVINDYPLNARLKVTSKDYLNLIYDMTNCQVSVRGTLFEGNKKVPLGQKKQYLHIEGENLYQVNFAYKEIKRVIEEAAMRNLNPGAHVGKFKMQ